MFIFRRLQMGVYKLKAYLNTYDGDKPYTEKIVGKTIQNSRVIYIDALSKLIEIYEQFMKSDEEKTFAKLTVFELEKFTLYLTKISYYKRKVNVFIDYRYVDDIDVEDTILFPEFLPEVPPDFDLYIRKVDDVHSIDVNSVRLQNDVDSKKFDGKVSNFVKVSELLPTLSKDDADYVNDVLKVGAWHRHLIRNKGKEYVKEIRRKEYEPTIHIVDVSQEQNEMSETSQNLFRQFVHTIDKFVHRLKNNPILQDVTFYGCSIESDFAMTKHITAYNNNTYPIVITNDTDMLVLLCNVNCLIKFILKHHVYYINPVNFWRYVFGTVLPPNIIKMLCVMKGTDYNCCDERTLAYTFEQLLRRMNVPKFSDLTEQGMYEYFYNYFSTNKHYKNSAYTALALNMYLIDIESTFYVM